MLVLAEGQGARGREEDLAVPAAVQVPAENGHGFYTPVL